MPAANMRHTSLQRAFTLVEVMFVTMIVGTLSAILFPVVAQGKDAAKKANCLSNLKQISAAVLLYAVDYDDRTCFGIGPGTSLPEGSRYWWGFVSNQGEVDYGKGMLGPYLKSGPVQACPSAPDMPPNGLPGVSSGAGNVPDGVTGYGHAGASADLSALEIPAETIMLGDAAGVLLPDPTPKRWAYAPPLFVNYALHARHSGEVAITAWHDGHAKAAKLSYRSFDSTQMAPAQTVPAAVMRAAHLGDHLKYSRKATSVIGITPQGALSQCDWYYYVSAKPRCE